MQFGQVTLAYTLTHKKEPVRLVFGPASREGIVELAKISLRYLSSEDLWGEALMAESPRMRQAAREVLEERPHGVTTNACDAS